MRQETEISPLKLLAAGAALLVVLGLGFSACSLVENVAADEIVVVQSLGGGLRAVTSQGPIWQGYGKVTSYPKRAKYDFTIPVRFNDGGEGELKGSIQWTMPLDQENLMELHTKYGSPDAIQANLIQTVVNKSVYMTGPLMSSKESYAEKRNYLISYVDDQVKNGVYKTIQKEVKVSDQLTGQEKTAVVVEIVQRNGQPERQEAAVLSEFGISTFNFTIESLDYSEAVDKQIGMQQQISQDVQIAIANARKAEQDKLTTEQRGAAAAAEAKWAQEVVKAKEVTAAQQRLEVAKLEQQVAEQYKQKKFLEADADATYRRKVMEADGALQQRLDAFVKVNAEYAAAIRGAQSPLVPGVVMGGTSGQTPGISDLISLMIAQSAKEAGIKKEQ